MTEDAFKTKARTAFLKKEFPEITDVRVQESGSRRLMALTFEVKNTRYYSIHRISDFESALEDNKFMIGYKIDHVKKLLSKKRRIDLSFIESQIRGYLKFRQGFDEPMDSGKIENAATELFGARKEIPETMREIETLKPKEYRRRIIEWP